MNYSGFVSKFDNGYAPSGYTDLMTNQVATTAKYTTRIIGKSIDKLVPCRYFYINSLLVQFSVSQQTDISSATAKDTLSNTQYFPKTFDTVYGVCLTLIYGSTTSTLGVDQLTNTCFVFKGPASSEPLKASFVWIAWGL